MTQTKIFAGSQEVSAEQLKELLSEQAQHLPKWQMIDASGADGEMSDTLKQLSGANVPISLALHCADEDWPVGLLVVIDNCLYELRLPAHVSDSVGTAMQAAAAKVMIMQAEAEAERFQHRNCNSLIALHRLAHQVTGNAETAITMVGQVYKDALDSKETIDREVTAALLEQLELTVEQARKDFIKESEPSE
jgi:hypothetical protein